MLDAGPYWVLDAERMPIVRERLVTSARAARLGLYCSCSMTSSTRCLVSGRMLGWSFSTRDTVWCETPARRATSRMLGALDPLEFLWHVVLDRALGMCTVTYAGTPLCTLPRGNVTVTDVTVTVDVSEQRMPPAGGRDAAAGAARRATTRRSRR